MKRVLVVDDDRENIDVISHYLAQDSVSIQTAMDGEQTLHRIRAWKPHLVLLDVQLPDVSGLQLISKIRSSSGDDYVSIVLVSANNTLDDVIQGLEAGADDYLIKPFRQQELLPKVKSMFKLKDVHDALKRANHRIEELIATDELTGLMNMHSLYRKGEEEILRARRFKKPVAALLINIDKFSAINQSHGFPFGNTILTEAGRRIKECLRSIDWLARVGADEFFALLIETDLASAEFVAERIRDALSSKPYKDTLKEVAQVTACIGVAGIPPDQREHQMSDLFHTTAEALRSAKVAGPNRVEIYSFS